VAELKRPDGDPSQLDRPIIYQEESGTPERYTHWYIVWRQFDGVSNEDRSRIILNAVEEECGREAALKVTTSMGLTPDDPLAKDLAEQPKLSPAPQGALAVREKRVGYGMESRRRKTPARGSRNL
jgi:hypothetical protein